MLEQQRMESPRDIAALMVPRIGTVRAQTTLCCRGPWWTARACRSGPSARSCATCWRADRVQHHVAPTATTCCAGSGSSPSTPRRSSATTAPSSTRDAPGAPARSTASPPTPNGPSSVTTSQLRKVALGTCERPYGTPCQHKHACIRCPVLRLDLAQVPRPLQIETNTRERLDEAHRMQWLGEVVALEESLRHIASKKEQADRGRTAGHSGRRPPGGPYARGRRP
jgi:hypothetical protein